MRPFLSLLLLPLLVFTACGGGASAVGTWQIDTAALEKNIAAMIETLPAAEREAAKTTGMDVLKGMFGGMTFELKADGTATMSMTVMGQKHDSAGTWKQTGDQVAITPKEKGAESRTMTLKNGKLSMKEKGPEGKDMELVFERK